MILASISVVKPVKLFKAHEYFILFLLLPGGYITSSHTAAPISIKLLPGLKTQDAVFREQISEWRQRMQRFDQLHPVTIKPLSSLRTQDAGTGMRKAESRGRFWWSSWRESDDSS